MGGRRRRERCERRTETKKNNLEKEQRHHRNVSIDATLLLLLIKCCCAGVLLAGANQGDIESNARSPINPLPRCDGQTARPKLRCTTIMMSCSMSLHCYRYRYLLLLPPPPPGSLKTWERKDIPASPSHPGDICCGIPPSQASLGPVSRFQCSSPSRAFTCHRVGWHATCANL